MQLEMDGRVALITGASTGLGKAMALRFAGAGARVALLARRPEVLEAAQAEVQRAGEGKALAIACDVTDPGAIAAAFARAESDLGPIDVLVNNAGSSQRGKFEEISDEMWRADLELKLFGAIRFARLAFPGMKARRWGRIINVLNTAAKAAPPGSAPTSVTRAAGMALTKVLAGEGAPYNVLVNAMLTGIIDSDQWVRRHRAAAPEQPYADFLQGMAEERGIPLGRIGTAEEFANFACFLASDAGAYITGTATNIDGGLSPVV